MLVVDDEPKMRRVLEFMLRSMGHESDQAGDGIEALAAVEAGNFDLVITDLRMPRMDGLEFLRELRQRGEDVPVIVLTAYGTIESAVEAMKLGASDYIIRPFEIAAVELAVTRALAVSVLHRENRFLRDEISKGWNEFIGTSEKMQALYRLVELAAPARSNIFIVGETGTGKELVARAIHRASGRTGLFVPINCAAIPAELLESELFGHEGAFTGALRSRVGKFELASGGTIFLDEITEMPHALQSKLLRVLQEGTIERVGANTQLSVDMRVVAATNMDPQRAVDEGKLRHDLFFRLNVLRIDVPLLRDRREDIPLLVEHFLRKYASELGYAAPRLSRPVLERLESYAWPGNVRELENLMERAAVLSAGSEVRLEHLPENITHEHRALPAVEKREPIEAQVGSLKTRVEALETELIKAALAQSDNNKSAAARVLEISERALWYKIKRYGIG
jgi:two-component system, NtrC family, response regulator AtoC